VVVIETCRQRSLRPEVTSLSQRKITENLDGKFLLLNGGLDKIFDRDHALQFTFFVHERQVANIGRQHLLHAELDGVFRRRSNKFAPGSRNLLNQSILRGASQQGNLGDVVTLGDDTGEISYDTP
jgi:hypothetical protein